MADSRNFFDLSNRKILVTGASSGIGRAISIYLSELGARIVLTGRNSDRLQETLSRMKGNKHLVISYDLGNEGDFTELFDHAVADGVKLNGMVYSAGVIPMLPLQSMRREKVSAVMRINFTSFLECVRLYAKNKYANTGSIVGISSIAAIQPEPGQTLYAASKAAMNAAVLALAPELAGKQIRINTIMPGMTEPECGFCEKDQILIQKQRLGAVGREDIAGLCVYLLSDRSRAVSGRPFYLDGGRFYE